jgi:hypothetical protein
MKFKGVHWMQYMQWDPLQRFTRAAQHGFATTICALDRLFILLHAVFHHFLVDWYFSL